MLVSILVAHYAGHERNLERSLRTLLAQTYSPIEIIIVDDGSERDFVQEGVQYFRLRPFGSSSRNCIYTYQEAYRRCKGDFIILTDADILVPCEAVQVMMDHADHNGRIVPILYGLDRIEPDIYRWECDIDVLQSESGFWGWRTPQGAYNLEAQTVKHHLLFSGQRRELWDASGLFTAGEVNPEHYMVQFGNLLQIPIHVYHQWHRRGEQYSARIRRIQCIS